MKPTRPPDDRDATDDRLPDIQRRMLERLRDPATVLALRVSLAIALLKAPAFAMEAERELQDLCADPTLDPAIFAKISKALTVREAGLTQQLRRERAAAATKRIDFKGPATWDMLIDDKNEGLMDRWRAAHPEVFDQSAARRLGCSTSHVRDWARNGPPIAAILRAAGIPQFRSYEAADAWWLRHGAAARTKIGNALAPFFGKWSETTSE